MYSYDGLGRRVAKTCLNTDTGEIVSRQVFTYVGNDLVAEHTTAGDVSGVVGRVWVQDPGTGEMIGQINLTTDSDSVGGVSGWSQAQVDAVFYALVADLAGAPQELIDTEQGSVVGHVTQSLFGRRQWSGVDSPVLFAGQYEDAESGWVYNRFRFYDPASGVYGSQDPLGVGPNVGTPQGYVHNPITWADALGLKAHYRKIPDNRPVQATSEQPFRGGQYNKLGTVGPNPTPDSYIPYERHHIVSADALTRAGMDDKKALALQMEIDDHQMTRSWGKGGESFRDKEFAMLQNGQMDDLVLDELAHIESSFGGKYADGCMEALEFYIKNF